jgi:hypothetical protein
MEQTKLAAAPVDHGLYGGGEEEPEDQRPVICQVIEKASWRAFPTAFSMVEVGSYS